MDYHGLVKSLDLPAGWAPPTDLAYDDIAPARSAGPTWTTMWWCFDPKQIPGKEAAGLLPLFFLACGLRQR